MNPNFLTREQVRRVDQLALTEYGIPGVVLMENAGRGCADWFAELDPQRQPVAILCGPGNNGGDGLVMARHLSNHGWPVRCLVFAQPGQLSPDAAIHGQSVIRLGLVRFVPIEEITEFAERLNDELGPTGWIVDALYGTGLNRPLRPPMTTLMEAIQALRRPVFAVDLPSGLDCDTGLPLGVAVRATVTATFVAPKVGFTKPAASEWLGEVRTIDIGVPRQLISDIWSV